ncbi:P-loop NTPase fold protein [Streptomyces sp. N50]|uniref:P-loop NTPase fold protein n=1 Tax=Streptomyces sp. N50 TaxID=3081765 RepID=UPI00296212B3|nr:P-loop NTPase fold protein [Streptomyces sp. N50]WOX11617.1 P-loop NTPase fold protein [Streptomyces sp. N50]
MGRRAILVAGSEFAVGSGGESSEYPPLPFSANRVTHLAEVLARFGFECDVLRNPTSQSMSREIQRAFNDAGPEDFLVVHVLSHSRPRVDGGLGIVGIDSHTAQPASVDDWINTLRHMAEGPQTLFVLDLCEAGAATPMTSYANLPRPAPNERIWVIAGTDSREMAFDGKFTQAITRVLGSISDEHSGLGPDLAYAPFSYLTRETQREFTSVSQGTLPQTVVIGPGNTLDASEFRFFRNPGHLQPPVISHSHIPRTDLAGRVLCVSPLGETHRTSLVAVGGDDSLRVFDLRTGAQTARVHMDGAFAVVPVPGQDLLVCAGRRGAVEVRSSVDLAFRTELWADTSQVNDLACGAVDGRWTVWAVSDDGYMRSGDTKGGTQLHLPRAHDGFANAVVAAGALVVSAGSGGDVAAWDSSTSDLRWRVSEHSGPVHRLVALPVEGRQAIVSGGEDGTLQVLDLSDGTLLRTIPARSTPIRAMTVLPGPRPCVAVGGPTEPVSVWDVATGERVAALADGSDIWSLATVEVDGRIRLITGNDEGVVPLPLPDPTPAAAPWLPDPVTTLHAGYTADVAEGTDRLGIGQQVDTLCQLIMAREVRPPLSIGLFGDWGTGKSFFMAQMRQRVQELVHRAKQADLEQVGSGLCGGVCEIQFNAWHYLDANLWSGLASAIFDRLALGDAPTREILHDLPSVQTLRQELLGKRAAAQAQLDEVAQDLAQEDPVGIRDVLTVDHLKQVQDVLTEPVVKQTKLALTEAGISPKEIGKLELRTKESMGYVQRLWLLLRRGKPSVRLLMLVAIVLFVVVGPLLSVVLRNLLGTGINALAPVLLCCVAASAIAGPYLSRLGRALRVAEDAVQQVDEHRRIPLRAKQEALRRRITRIEEETASIDDSIRELRQESSLRAFALKRLAEDDYRQHEGLMALLRRDLEELSRRFTAPNSGRAAAPDLERIVLYIDDLDRCPPHRVVEVLQAIQLLLAFPLFVVVVGVDARWLLRSIQTHYRDVLGSDGLSTVAKDSRHWASTPENYLEKIFQISLCLPPMSEDGYTSLVGADLGEFLPDASGEHTNTDTDTDNGAATDGTGQPSTRREPAAQTDPQPSRPAPASAPEPAADPQVRRVDARELHLFQGVAPFTPIAAVALHDDQPLLLSVDSSAVLTHRDLRQREAPTLTRKIADGRLATAEITTDGRVLLTGDLGESGDIVALTTDGLGKTVSMVEHPVPQGPAADSVIFSDGGGKVALSWHKADGTAEHIQESVLPGTHETDTTAPTPGALLARTDSWQLVETADGVRLRPSDSTGDTGDSSSDVVVGTDHVERVVLDPTTGRLALIGAHPLLGLWSTAGTPEPIRPVYPLPELPELSADLRIAFSATDLIAIAANTWVRVWDLVSGALHTELTAASPVTALAFSPNGRRLATGSRDGTVQVWAVENPDPDVARKLEALRLTRAEHDMVTSVGPLISTPRTARRLVNTYRLLRTCLSGPDIERVRSGDHAPLILLLAVLIGYPAQGAAVLEDLLHADDLPQTFTALLRRDHRDHMDRPPATDAESEGPRYIWGRLASVTADISTRTGTSDETADYRHWAPYVARFSFRTGHLL